MSQTYTVKQVAEILGYSTNSIYTFLKEKRIKGVRVGKGRFRIPQSELDRLLFLGKNQTSIIQTATVAPLAVTSDVPLVDVPSLFDWFVGIGSIVMGLAMHLFSKSYEEFEFARYLTWIPVIRMFFIAGGFGLLLADIRGKKTIVWNKVFHAFLMIGFGWYSTSQFMTGSLDGALIYGLLALAIGISIARHHKKIHLFTLYISSICILLPLLLLVTSGFSVQTPVIWICAAFAILSSSALFAGVFFNRGTLLVGAIGTTVMCIFLSYYFANQLLWGRAFTLLTAGLLTSCLPVWISLTFIHKRDRTFIFSIFGSLLLLLTASIGFIRMVQTSLLSYASRELENKVTYGKAYIETSLESIKTTLTSFASNPLLVEAIQKEDLQSLQNVSKAMFEGNIITRSVLTISANGDILTMYPYGSTTQANVSHEAYFLRASETGKPVVSDIFESVSGDIKRKVIAISVPVYSNKGVFVGVVVGSLDIDTLGNSLQKLASDESTEYFIVLDATGKRVIHPDRNLIGVEADQNDPIRQGLLGKRVIQEGYGYNGVRAIVSVDSINDSTGWAIGMSTPVASVLRSTSTARITIMVILLVSACVISIFMISHKTKTMIQGDTS